MSSYIPKSAAGTQVVIDKRSFDRLMINLRELPRRTSLRVFRIALNAWGGVIKDVAKATVRRESGTLAKSLTVKVKIPDASYNAAHHGKPAYVMVGPARRSGRMLTRKLRGHGKAQRFLVKTRKEISGFGISPLAREPAAVGLTKRKFTDAFYRNPSRYAHLVEKGSRRSRDYPFLSVAARAGEGAGFEKFAAKMREGLAAEASKLKK